MKLFSTFATVVFCATLVGCGPSEPKPAQDQNEAVVEVVGTDEFEKGISKADAQLVDVRTEQEVSQGHIPEAKFFDIMEPGFEEKLETLDKGKPVYVYCRSGSRSANAAEIMKEMGFTKIYNLDGGFSNWKNNDKPVEKP